MLRHTEEYRPKTGEIMAASKKDTVKTTASG